MGRSSGLKKVLKISIIPILFLSLFFVLNLNANAQSSDLKKIRCTCYIDSGITASGQETRDGIIAGQRSDFGKIAALYQYNEDGSIGEFIGYYEFLDTGAGIDTDGDGKGDSIKKGLSVDIWKNTLTEANKWIAEYGDYVYIKIIDAEG